MSKAVRNADIESRELGKPVPLRRAFGYLSAETAPIAFALRTVKQPVSNGGCKENGVKLRLV